MCAITYFLEINISPKFYLLEIYFVYFNANEKKTITTITTKQKKLLFLDHFHHCFDLN